MIILLGLPKSGTTSFNELFKQLGYNTVHWRYKKKYIGMIIKKNKELGKPLLDTLDVDCITQMDVCLSNNIVYWAQIIDYERIYEENQNAIFILNKRNPEKVLKSFKNWNNYLERLFKFSGELIENKTDAGFIDFVIKHNNNIEEFFKDKESAKFISYDIENDNIEKLSAFIDLKNITCFPHKNKNKKNI